MPELLLKVGGGLVTLVGGAIGMKWVVTGNPRPGDWSGSAGHEDGEKPYPGYSTGAPPPFVDPTGKGLIGGLLGGAAFGESFYTILLILSFIIVVRYLKH